jgi:hypothetical protein
MYGTIPNATDNTATEHMQYKIITIKITCAARVLCLKKSNIWTLLSFKADYKTTQIHSQSNKSALSFALKSARKRKGASERIT